MSQEIEPNFLKNLSKFVIGFKKKMVRESNGTILFLSVTKIMPEQQELIVDFLMEKSEELMIFKIEFLETEH